MTSVWYLIIWVNLLYTFDQAECISNSKTWRGRKEEEEFILNHLTIQNQDKILAKKLSSYSHLDYEEQLHKKQRSCIKIVDMIVKLSHNLKNLMNYNLLNIIPSPILKGYRNRDLFRISFSVDKIPKTVGCILGRRYSVRPTNIVTIKESHKRVAKVYEDLIRLSPLRGSMEPHGGGHWNTLLIRSNEEGDLMAAVSVHPNRLSPEVIQSQQYALKSYFFRYLPNITLLHQVCSFQRCTHDVAPFNVLYGKPYIIDTLNGCKFKIEPDSFFPINKFAAEELYDTIVETAKLKPNTILLDVFSGTGTSSIVLSKFVKSVFGFESVPEAVADAKYFAVLNNITNTNFLWGRVDVNLKSVMESQNSSSDVVAILNHRQSGLGFQVIKTIRRSLQISRIVYIYYKDSNPSVVQNFVDLCSINNVEFPPFRLTKVIPIDLLPQTRCVDLILYFQREPFGHFYT